jgi:type I restriction enzyme S subunit
MSFPKYSDYSKSETSWSPSIPSNWKVLPAKRGFNRRKELNTGMKCGNRLSLTLNGVLPRSLDDLDGLQASEFETYQVFQKDELVFKLIDLQNIKTSRVGLVHEEGIMSPAYIRLEPNKSLVFPRYAYWFFTDLYKREVFNKLGEGVRQTLGPEELLALPFFYPTLEEQKKIVNFLDHETLKIDKLVTEQEKLIELLKEKRQAVISNAVTKGLNPNVKMKNSGVVWLGDIPDHWGVRAIKHIVSTPVTDGPHETPEFFDDGVPFVSAEAVSSGEIDFSKIRGYISLESHKQYSLKYLPKKGDIFMIKSGATTGVTAIVETDQEFNIWSPLAVVRCNAESNPYYVLNFMRSLNFQEAVALNWNFGTQQNIGMGVIENLFCPVPSQQEQKAIAEYLTSFTKQFNTLISEANNAIELLKERRSALISAAVTGQIDVRNYQPKEAA